MKRKAEELQRPAKAAIKRAKKAVSSEEAKKRFRKGLFDPAVLDQYTKEYAASTPYRHAVIHELMDDKLLRSVRDEIRENVSFTPKETDIYKIHQSGDLANLDGLEDEALAKLPSLLTLRDAIYSQAFRDYVSHTTGCGPLSGRKTDIAINIYTPGCYLLCHDDVIGSRKISYILYLTDPENPWQSEWGGALRLFPVTEEAGENGEVAKICGPDPVKVIPPAWNQLSFFAVQPGYSFHDVEEVYRASSPEQLKKDGGRVRMAISGWFHIPQPGEDGYVEGAEEEQVKNSGLMQLQGNPDQHDRPEAKVVAVRDSNDSTAKAAAGSKAQSGSQDSHSSQEFNEADLEFLLKYLSPAYLTPDALSGIADYFQENSSITLPTILNANFGARLKAEIEKREKETREEDKPWQVAKPPHKHRFLYLQQDDAPADSPWHELLNVFLPSMPFRTWLEMATDTTVESFDLAARRFRRGLDYTLATGYEGPSRLELNLGLTPTQGWGDAEEEEEEEEDEEEEAEPKGKGKGKEVVKNRKNEKNEKNGNGQSSKEETGGREKEDEEVGGHEVYMAGEEDTTEDAAIYKSASDDDNILFFQAAAWNKMTIVLRDSGTLRFVKYVSGDAPGDRWDVSATYGIEDDEDEDPNAGIIDSSEEEEFKGFSSSEDSDSD